MKSTRPEDLSIYVNSPSNWNGSDVIKGDASNTWSTTNIDFYNNQQGLYSPPPVTYDLTSNTFSHVGVYGGGDNITLLINNADATGVQSFNASGLADKLVTAGSTLDLSHTTVSGFTVASTNALGTTFTVGDLGTALRIAGGSGHDTIVATGFTFSADQRTEIFATSSIETITDQTGTYAAPPAPMISGTVSGQPTTSEAACQAICRRNDRGPELRRDRHADDHPRGRGRDARRRNGLQQPDDRRCGGL